MQSIPSVLTPEDRQSALWRKVSAHLVSRLADLREQNDNDLDATASAKLRGRIAEVKNLAGLDDPAPERDASDDN